MEVRLDPSHAGDPEDLILHREQVVGSRNLSVEDDRLVFHHEVHSRQVALLLERSQRGAHPVRQHVVGHPRVGVLPAQPVHRAVGGAADVSDPSQDAVHASSPGLPCRRVLCEKAERTQRRPTDHQRSTDAPLHRCPPVPSAFGAVHGLGLLLQIVELALPAMVRRRSWPEQGRRSHVSDVRGRLGPLEVTGSYAVGVRAVTRT